jgi:hypothetical protein
MAIHGLSQTAEAFLGQFQVITKISAGNRQFRYHVNLIQRILGYNEFFLGMLALL